MMKGGRGSWDIGGALWNVFEAIDGDRSHWNVYGGKSVLLLVLSYILFPTMLMAAGAFLGSIGMPTECRLVRPRTHPRSHGTTPVWHLAIISFLFVVVISVVVFIAGAIILYGNGSFYSR